MKRGDIAAALKQTDKTLARFPSEKSEWHWRFRLLKAEILHRQGQNNEALALASPEIPSSLPSDLPIRRKLAQGAAFALTQQLPEANRVLSEAEDLAKTTHPDLLGEIAMRRGTVWFLAGEPEKAEAEYHKSLQIARERNDAYLAAGALEGLGVAATKMERYDQAVDWDRAALVIARSVGAKHSIAQTLGNMAWCYRKLGDYENALALYNQAEKASAEVGDIADQLYWLTGIENVYYEQGNFRAAQTLLEQALGMARNQDDKLTLTEFLNDLSEIAVETGQVELAGKYQTEAAEIEKVSPDPAGVLESVLIQARIRERLGDHRGAAGLFQQIISDPKTGSSQKWQAQARLAKLYVEQGAGLRAEQEFRRSLDTIEEARASVQTEELRMSFLATSLSFWDDYIEFLMAQGRVIDALRIAELSRSRTLAEGLNARPDELSLASRNFHPQQIAGHLNATLLFYWVGEHSYLWLITPRQVRCFPLVKKAELERAVRTYRQSILDGRDVLAANSSEGSELFDELLGPAAKLIPENGRVIVLPSEALYGLNFETLIVPKPSAHYWIEDVTLSEAGSLNLLSATTHHHINAASNILLIGNPDPPSSDFPALAQGPEEMQKVADHFSERTCTVLRGKQATPSAYLESHPERFSYLHFVTHGTASHTSPLESAVILSKEGDSFKLYARDIVAHPLQARLVTISACNGTGTRAYAGEGLVGLSWAFLRAGARNVVAALWEVSDASSTAQLMDEFYTGLNRGEAPATALRKAKLSILKSNTVFEKPFYWAPFQLYVASQN